MGSESRIDELFNGFAQDNFNFAIDGPNTDLVVNTVSCALKSLSHSNCNIFWSKELTLGATRADIADKMSAS